MAGFPRRSLLAAIGPVVAIGAASACSSAPRTTLRGLHDVDNMFADAPIATEAELGSSETAMGIKRRGRLVVGGQSNTALMRQINPITGETEGMDAMLSKLLAHYILGQSAVDVVSAGATTREVLIQNGTVDVVIWVYSITEERAQKVAFAGPYLISGQSIAVRTGNDSITTPDDLDGHKVIVIEDSTGHQQVLQRAPEAELVLVTTPPACTQALVDGRGDAVVLDLPLLAAEKRLQDSIKIVGNPFGFDPYGIGLRHGDLSFKKFINDWLVKIEDAGLWERAWKESLGTVVEGLPPDPPPIGQVPGT